MKSRNQELEAKFYITKPKDLEAHLKKLGAELIQARTPEYNLRFDTPDQKLAQDHRLLRLRKDQAVHLTYKGPASDQNGVSVREEIELTVGDIETANKLLIALGYRVSAIYEKNRTTYALDHLHITIDEMPYGVFVEIEGGDVESIRSAAETIGLNWDTHITKNYLELFYQLKEALNLEIEGLTFESFEGVETRLDIIGIRAADG
jgi:adenylate cyclase class 2